VTSLAGRATDALRPAAIAARELAAMAATMWKKKY